MQIHLRNVGLITDSKITRNLDYTRGLPPTDWRIYTRDNGVDFTKGVTLAD